MGVTVKHILFAINEQTGTMKTFGHFRSFEDLADKLTSILNQEDPEGWPDGWTPYMFESWRGSFSHPVWYTPNPEGSTDTDAWLPVAFDPFVDLPLAAMTETVRGDAIDERGCAYDAWIIQTRPPTIAELFGADWKKPTKQDFSSFDISASAMVAELGNFLAFADRKGDCVELQVHGTVGAEPVFWRASVSRWEDFA